MDLPLLNVLSGQKPREIAAQVLAGRLAGDDYVENLLEKALARAPLSPPDRGLCQELVYGVVRWQDTLDWLIARKTGRRPQKPPLQILLRLGLYQIFWLDRIPDHAAVNETVDQARHSGFGPQAGFVNAVLRGYLREDDDTKQLLADLKRTQPALGRSHPEWLAARWQQRWGAEKAARLMDWNNTSPKTCARINPLRFAERKFKNAGDLLTQWREEDVEYDFIRRDWFDENLVFELKSHPPLATLPSFQQGLFYVQDPSTLLAVRELDPQPGETILDLCAAPGGKTTYIAQLMKNKGRLAAHDTSPDRLKLVEENCARLGVTCVKAVSEAWERRLPPGATTEAATRAGAATGRVGVGVQASACPPNTLKRELQRAESRPSPLALRPSSFDRVLLDAPCSNTGVMGRRVDLRWRFRLEELERLGKVQLDLLRRAAPLVKPGGTLVYSTCSLEPEENREVVERFLQDQPGFKQEGERELLPFADEVDGAFVARLARSQS